MAAANLRDETVEKMSAPFALRVHGRSGHASMPGIAGNALVKAARLVGRLAAFRPEPQFGPEAEAFLRSVLGEVPPAAAAVERTRALSPAAADLELGVAWLRHLARAVCG